MRNLAATPFVFPDETMLEINPVDRLENPVLRSASEYWHQLRGRRRFPSREELNPGGFSVALRHMAMVRVIDGGADYEYRIVGDTLACEFSIPLNSRTVSDIAVNAPATAALLRRVYKHAVQSGEPFAVCGTTGRNAETAMFTHLEAVVLPMGADESTVDHLLTFMVCESNAK